MAEAAAALDGHLPDAPQILVVAGSGLGQLGEVLERGEEIPFGSIPGYPPTGVAGHAGSYLSGRLAGVPALIQRGRFHLYEGHEREIVTLPIRVAALLGVRWIILTNAAGGIRTDLSPGTIVLLRSCLDFQSRPVPPPLELPLSGALQDLARSAARSAHIPLAEGRYAGVLGPSFETPAEIRMLAAFGGDVVGMSTVAEAEAAAEAGIPLLGLSLVTNRAAGVGAGVLNHEEVLKAGADASSLLVKLIRSIVEVGGAFPSALAERADR